MNEIKKMIKNNTTIGKYLLSIFDEITADTYFLPVYEDHFTMRNRSQV